MFEVRTRPEAFSRTQPPGGTLSSNVNARIDEPCRVRLVQLDFLEIFEARFLLKLLQFPCLGDPKTFRCRSRLFMQGSSLLHAKHRY